MKFNNRCFRFLKCLWNDLFRDEIMFILAMCLFLIITFGICSLITLVPYYIIKFCFPVFFASFKSPTLLFKYCVILIVLAIAIIWFCWVFLYIIYSIIRGICKAWKKSK